MINELKAPNGNIKSDPAIITNIFNYNFVIVSLISLEIYENFGGGLKKVPPLTKQGQATIKYRDF